MYWYFYLQFLDLIDFLLHILPVFMLSFLSPPFLPYPYPLSLLHHILSSLFVSCSLSCLSTYSSPSFPFLVDLFSPSPSPHLSLTSCLGSFYFFLSWLFPFPPPSLLFTSSFFLPCSSTLSLSPSPSSITPCLR